MAERDAVLFANEAFYVAFGARDIAAMAGLWATAASVTCIHPGWAPLFGREDVLDSWDGIFSGDASPQITCHGAQAYVYGDVATVLCYERLPDGYLIATNVFVREGGIWKMVHHQAGPTQGGPVSDEEIDRPQIN